MTARLSKLVVLPAVVALMVVGACSSGGGQSDGSAKREITATWTAFFSGKGSIDQLQDGTTLQQAYQQNLSSPLAKSSTAKVKKVTLLASNDCSTNDVPAPCAQVTYDVLVGGQPLLSDSRGYATKQNGKWKVSKTSFCALLALANNGQAPAGC
jgi:hypothetical protein